MAPGLEIPGPFCSRIDGHRPASSRVGACRTAAEPVSLSGRSPREIVPAAHNPPPLPSRVLRPVRGSTRQPRGRLVGAAATLAVEPVPLACCVRDTAGGTALQTLLQRHCCRRKVPFEVVRSWNFVVRFGTPSWQNSPARAASLSPSL